jgi:hypothetical protein
VKERERERDVKFTVETVDKRDKLENAAEI